MTSLNAFGFISGLILAGSLLCGGCYAPKALPQPNVHTLQPNPAQPLTFLELRTMAQEISDRIGLELAAKNPPVPKPRVLIKPFGNEAYGRYLSQLQAAGVIVENGFRANGFGIVTDEGLKAIAERIEENANGVLEKPTLVDLLQSYDPPKYLLFGKLSEHQQRGEKGKLVSRTYILTVRLYDVVSGELSWTAQVFCEK